MKRFSDRGFSLIETIIVIAVLVIGLAIAVPSFTEMGRRNAVKAEAREMKNILARARMDAVRRNESLTADIDTGANRCTVSVTGGAAISSTDFNGVQLATSPNPLSIVWDSRGMTTNFCTISVVGQDETYNVIVSSAGNIRIAKP